MHNHGMNEPLPKLFLLSVKNVPIYQQLQLEEALLRTDHGNWCLLNEGSPLAIVMGISGKAEELIHFERHTQAPCPIVRRFSGGGTVVVDENTLFATFIGQSQILPGPTYPKEVMEWSRKLYQHVFQDLEFDLQENDYAIGPKKIGGNAQYISRNRWLHHTSFLWDYSNETMNYLLHPPKTPAYRAGRGHQDFLGRLCQFWTKDQLFLKLKEELNKQFRVEEVDWQTAIEAVQKPHRRATTFVEIIAKE